MDQRVEDKPDGKNLGKIDNMTAF